jgi:Tfp pilus assembly PilM family ATPase
LISEKNTRDDYVVEAVQRVFKENKIKPKNVACAIASEEAMVRYFQMPKIPTKEWRSAINFEAKRYIPFRMEDVASDFQVIHGKAASMTMDVVFVAVRQNTIERFITLLEKAGIRPIIIEPAPFSLIRAFNAAGQIDNKINTAIINIETKLTNISILRNGVPYIIRDIPLDEGVSGEGSLEPIFERLLSEIKLSFDFYEKQFPSETIDKIIIYSQLPLENWHELVGKELQIAIEVGDPLRGIRIKKGIVPPRVAIAFGLALRGLSETFIDVNLCKERLFVYRKKEMFLKMVFLEASAAVFLLIIAKLLCLKAIAPLSNELSRTLSERPKEEVNIKDENIDALERLKNEMEAKKYVMDNIITKRTYFTGRWEGLVKVMPKNIWLTEVSFEEKIDKKDISKVFREFDIKGYCIIDGKISESDTVNSFLIGLKENAAINKGMYKADIVSVEKTELNGEKVSRFEILFTGP